MHASKDQHMCTRRCFLYMLTIMCHRVFFCKTILIEGQNNQCLRCTTTCLVDLAFNGSTAFNILLLEALLGTQKFCTLSLSASADIHKSLLMRLRQRYISFQDCMLKPISRYLLIQCGHSMGGSRTMRTAAVQYQTSAHMHLVTALLLWQPYLGFKQ